MQNRRINCIIQGLFLIVMIWICIGIVLAHFIDYPCKKYFPVTQILFNLVVIIVVALSVRFVLKQILLQNNSKIKIEKIVLWGTIIFCCLQIYMTVNYYFLTDWDVDLIYQSAVELARGTFSSSNRYGEFCWYYSVYPNNMELLWIMYACLKINQFFGIIDSANGIMIFIIVNCMLMSVTGYLLYKIVTSMISRIWGIFSWLMFLAFIGLSPWVTIPYSDSLGLIFPVLILWLCMRLSESRHKIPYTIAMGFLSGVGYHIKPQTGIVFIAIIMLWGITCLQQCVKQVRARRMAICLALCIMAFASSTFIPKAIAASLDIPINSDRTFGMSHFLMMGMNPKTRGVYSQDDCDYSNSFDTPEQRKNGELQKVKERLEEYGFKGYAQLLNEKLLTTYADGTFAWGCEGAFWKEILPEKNEGVSHWTREFYYRDGKFYTEFLSYSQAWWMVILSLACFTYKSHSNNFMVVIQLAILGLTAFELLFEARARYLYTFSPLFIILAVCGLRKIKPKLSSIFRDRKRLETR